jgi:signal peptidase II
LIPRNVFVTARVDLAVRFLPFALVTAITTIADLLSKAWAARALASGPRAVVDGRLNFVLAHNRHGAMGLLSSAPEQTRRVLLVALGIAAAAAIVAYARRVDSIARIGLALVLGGAIGNLVDRVARGAVVDFIDVVLYRGHHWYTFNVADVAVVAGVVLAMVGATRKTAAA